MAEEQMDLEFLGPRPNGRGPKNARYVSYNVAPSLSSINHEGLIDSELNVTKVSKLIVQIINKIKCNPDQRALPNYNSRKHIFEKALYTL